MIITFKMDPDETYGLIHDVVLEAVQTANKIGVAGTYSLKDVSTTGCQNNKNFEISLYLKEIM